MRLSHYPAVARQDIWARLSLIAKHFTFGWLWRINLVLRWITLYRIRTRPSNRIQLQHNPLQVSRECWPLLPRTRLPVRYIPSMVKTCGGSFSILIISCNRFSIYGSTFLLQRESNLDCVAKPGWCCFEHNTCWQHPFVSMSIPSSGILFQDTLRQTSISGLESTQLRAKMLIHLVPRQQLTPLKVSAATNLHSLQLQSRRPSLKKSLPMLQVGL